jgi:hypothetical protein
MEFRKNAFQKKEIIFSCYRVELSKYVIINPQNTKNSLSHHLERGPTQLCLGLVREQTRPKEFEALPIGNITSLHPTTAMFPNGNMKLL